MDSRGAAPRMARPTRRRSPDARARANASRDLVATTGSTVRLRSIRCTHTVRYGGSGGVRFIGSDPPHGSRARACARASRAPRAVRVSVWLRCGDLGDGVYNLPLFYVISYTSKKVPNANCSGRGARTRAHRRPCICSWSWSCSASSGTRRGIRRGIHAIGVPRRIGCEPWRTRCKHVRGGAWRRR